MSQWYEFTIFYVDPHEASGIERVVPGLPIKARSKEEAERKAAKQLWSTGVLIFAKRRDQEPEHPVTMDE